MTVAYFFSNKRKLRIVYNRVLDFRPEGPQQISPGQSAAPPWELESNQE